jgi:CDP-diacylglycerol---glycerol-3-phosphate 3-phosphatidyltransferase
MTDANKITIFRLCMAPVFVFVFYYDGLWQRIILLLIAISMEFSDFMDGYIARKYNQVTDFGKLVDPFADSVSRFTIFLCFVYAGWAHLWMVALIFWRDALVANLRIFAASKNIIISARTSGKVKAVFQGTASITILLLNIVDYFYTPLPIIGIQLADVSTFLMLIVTIVTLWSAVDYVLGSRKILKTLKY